MEEIYACLAYEPGLFNNVELKKIDEPVWILGKKYNLQEDNISETINDDIKNLIWFTYRKQFEPIGETSLTTDSGWGCMHRCGQMIMAQALVVHHLGKEWKWKPDCLEDAYRSILNKFDDKVECPFSIHKIASRGHILERQIGQWFGPNTIVQVLKKLAEEDKETDIVVHVAMDNMVIQNEIRKLFQGKCKKSPCPHPPFQNDDLSDTKASTSTELDAPCSGSGMNVPVLVTVPLRLGLYEIAPAYHEKLKAVFRMKQSIGIIGGRTNHASYFIGYVGDELICLDPHTTQLHISEGPMEDNTYHCHTPSRMKFSQLEPSIALCFYMEDQNDFDQWCLEAKETLLQPEKDAVFEILEEKPAMLPYMDIEDCDDFNASFSEKDRTYTSDDEFELLM